MIPRSHMISATSPAVEDTLVSNVPDQDSVIDPQLLSNGVATSFSDGEQYTVSQIWHFISTSST